MKDMKETLQGILETTRKEIPEVVAICVVSCEDGISIADFTLMPDFKADIAAAFGTKAVASCKKAIKAMSQKNELIEVLLSKPDFVSLFRLIGQKYWLGIVLAPTVNLGITRVLLRKFEEELMETLY
jgi:predicted regulator of Ras-like GTPase activity (Roadblock/LC7/MglB family)